MKFETRKIVLPKYNRQNYENDIAVEWRLVSNSKLHREDGPAKIWRDGSETWYYNGVMHRRDGPAVLWADGTRMWYKYGVLHREDGPAKEYADGRREWWLRGVEVDPIVFFITVGNETF